MCVQSFSSSLKKTFDWSEVCYIVDCLYHKVHMQGSLICTLSPVVLIQAKTYIINSVYMWFHLCDCDRLFVQMTLCKSSAPKKTAISTRVNIGGIEPLQCYN